MLDIIISLLTFVLILISLFLVLVILMQRADPSGGMGSAFGGGVADSAFGTETTNVLAKATKWAALAFFLISLTLYLLFISRASEQAESAEDVLPDIPVVETSTAIPAQADVVAEVVESVQEAGAEAQAAVDGFTGEAVDEGSVTETPPSP